jgi:hypothetical protein
MKYTRSLVALSVAAVSVAACKTDLTSLNSNPNSPTTAPATTLFTNATINAAGRWVGAAQLSQTELFAQHLAQVQYVEEDRGRLRTENIDAWFAGGYTSELEDYAKVIAIGTAAASPNTAGPAKVMQMWVFQNMTDMWGDIPFSEALKGDLAGPLKPKYDAQKDIYYAMMATLDTASNTMVVGSLDPALGSADPIYAGDITKWLKLSNSLRARMALRMSKAAVLDATVNTKMLAELAAAFAAPGGTLSANTDNAKVTWPGDGVFNNPWAGNFSTRDDHRVSKTLLDTMNALLDPRIPIYAQPTVADPTKYTGLQNGMNNVTVTPFFNTTSRVGSIFYPGTTTYGTFGTSAGNKTPTNIMTYAELCFIKAEMANKNIPPFTAAQAQGFYDAGVTASITQWGGTAGQATTYLAQAGVTYVAGATGLAQIGLQKWIALFGQGNEAWSNWRRTGYPATIAAGPSMYPELSATMPRRIPYPSNEQSVNAAALAAAITAQGGTDTYLTKFWWDK